MSLITSEQVIRWLERFAGLVTENKNYLTQLDAAIGDADHGANMDRGFQAVLAKKSDLAGKDITTILKTVAMTLLSTVGGASGPLYGTFFLQASQAAGGKSEISPEEFGALIRESPGWYPPARQSGPQETKPWWTLSNPRLRPMRSP